MPMRQRLIKPALSAKTTNDFNGLIYDSFDLCGCDVSCVFVRRYRVGERHWNTDSLHNSAGTILPFPTTFLAVSRTVIVYTTRKAPLIITRNQKMLLHPRYRTSKPPITGPKESAAIDPAVIGPIYLPRSAGLAISAATAYPIELVALLPALWRHRRPSKAP